MSFAGFFPSADFATTKEQKTFPVYFQDQTGTGDQHRDKPKYFPIYIQDQTGTGVGNKFYKTEKKRGKKTNSSNQFKETK